MIDNRQIVQEEFGYVGYEICPGESGDCKAEYKK